MFDTGSRTDGPEEADAGSDRLVGGTGHGTGDGPSPDSGDADAGSVGGDGSGVVGCVAGVMESLDGVAGVDGRVLIDVVVALE
ncbi:MAG: hypothetical protein ACK5O2_12385, partial [Microthrixaceae bacterium]